MKALSLTQMSMLPKKVTNDVQGRQNFKAGISGDCLKCLYYNYRGTQVKK